MRTNPAILLALQWLTAKANPVKQEPRSIDLLTWLESSDWSNPAIGQTAQREAEDAESSGADNEKNREVDEAVDAALANRIPIKGDDAKSIPSRSMGNEVSVADRSLHNTNEERDEDIIEDVSEEESSEENEADNKLQRRAFLDLFSWDNAKRVAEWTWPVVQPFLQQFINGLTQASESALNTKTEVAATVNAAKFVLGNGNPVDNKKRDTSELPKPEAEPEKLKKRQDFDDFLTITDQMGLDEVTEQKLTILFQTQTIMSHVSEIVMSAYFYAMYMSERVPDCAKNAFADWVNQTAANSSGVINIPVTNPDGSETVDQVNIADAAAVDLGAVFGRRRTKRAAGTDPFGNAAAGNVLEAARQLFLDFDEMSQLVDEKVKLANPNWPGMNADAEFVYRNFLLSMIAERMRDRLKRNITDINRGVLTQEVEDVVGEIDSFDLGTELINLAAANDPGNPYDLNPNEAVTYIIDSKYLDYHYFFYGDNNFNNFFDLDNDVDVNVDNILDFDHHLDVNVNIDINIDINVDFHVDVDNDNEHSDTFDNYQRLNINNNCAEGEENGVEQRTGCRLANFFTFLIIKCEPSGSASYFNGNILTQDCWPY
ncbi:hypothetical protein Dda_7637 [Drechslerella dactyloides]|uniref:Uncharacterized protein n=1 Tax=Drechslerella dactyloides TaxID=74499 RepID=A0AAD6ISR4_DREDA|nr:hypothetical protein Dda_7637 [Drechslerella dactyloides]